MKESFLAIWDSMKDKSSEADKKGAAHFELFLKIA